MTKALVTGIYGQEGSYLSEILTERGHEVKGIARTPSYISESPRRDIDFVTKKMGRGLSRLRPAERECFEVESLGDIRDWGYRKDYAPGMVLMCARSDARDVILVGGMGRSVGEVVSTTAALGAMSDWAERIKVRSPIVQLPR
jgi:GDP-D-mannose dehydratase